MAATVRMSPKAAFVLYDRSLTELKAIYGLEVKCSGGLLSSPYSR